MGVWYCCVRYPPVFFLASSSYSPKSSLYQPQECAGYPSLPPHGCSHLQLGTYPCLCASSCLHSNRRATGMRVVWRMNAIWEACQNNKSSCSLHSDCHTGRKRGPGWKGWASLLATEGEFLLLALSLVVHSPCYCNPGTPLAPPSAHAPHYSGWVINLKKER